MLSAEDVCRTDNFLDRLDNISFSSYNENLQIWEKSALSKHAYESHQDNFDIRNFKIMALRQGCTTSLNRLEAKTINELRLGVLGLNRMKI